ncbi:MdtA/MuxA family multidrug efflux RND transporter periplasmic adaptor subunit [Thauera linaloolentis]|uniref:Efflux transporter, RND family, MFP subunit n=1 Tax=Thauera linaloolentis (strain DSM 12138 / JCM 21573 / CCUG 41526 / CIP 105981 / IAM 15112 / NBRC 102519 / 47Lol) TaxID=1123367 RepID=N6YVS6_THAL4|nr:MdtA/MuxA family multidrug efflux RND transporter periplasmic adaptor subunit [Thauera linaloolentis]ENO86512.1 Efflux transporter, RND family, MFP subunit [Thauera linaloolentis 47Lol = DSM 12138]MCM8566501.1 MdtA/MuxA family multidrug efflux RND transporter periplasmic adaptor subunit [Thauera linaloolentis]
MLLAAAAVAATAWYFLRSDAQTSTSGAPRPGMMSGPVPVKAVAAERGELDVRLRAIGTVTPLASVTVRSRVDGELMKLAFEEGDRVRKGALLAEIDPAPYRVGLSQAEGQLQQNQAQLKNAETELARYRLLFEQDSIARQQVEAQEALVNQLRGTLKTNQAQVDDARLKLGWTRIEAPIEGRVGLRRVDAGNLISSGDTDGIVSIVQTRPIAVMFTVPERELATVREEMARGRSLQVEAWDRDDRKQIASGVLRTFDNQIDTATGTVRLKAEFANTDDALFPNQFVNIRLAVRSIQDAVTIPADAVQFGSRGSYVYVVADDKANVRPVALGASDGTKVVVESGIDGGEKVVLEGLDRLREGRAVTLVDSDGNEEAGTPAPGAQRQGG